MALTADVANKISRFSSALSISYDRLVSGGEFNGDCILPHRIVGMALNRDGGIICPLLDAYNESEPGIGESPLLNVIIQSIERIFEVAEDLARRLKRFAKSGISYVRRFQIAPRRLFAVGYLERLSAMRRRGSVNREWLLSRMCTAFRNLLEWMRSTLQELEMTAVTDPLRPITLSRHAREVVEMADARLGIIVLKAGPRIGSLPFHILPTSAKAWRTIRLLCECGDDDGYVALPENYASAFHHTDSGNETLDDDYARFVRHIVPGLKAGTYRLELAEKPRLRRDV